MQVDGHGDLIAVESVFCLCLCVEGQRFLKAVFGLFHYAFFAEDALDERCEIGQHILC